MSATTTAAVSSTFAAFTNLFANNGATLVNVALIVATIGGQSILKKLSFACPCAFPLNVYQSLVFILGSLWLVIYPVLGSTVQKTPEWNALIPGPSLALFVIGLMVHSTTWRLVHGCFFRHHDTRHAFKTALVYWIEVVVRASVAPAAWLFVAFLDGSYYLCLFAAQYCLFETAPQCKTANFTWKSDVQSFNMMSGNGKYCPECICSMQGPDATFLESQSNIIAWFLLIFYGACAFLTVCCISMCDKYTLLQRNYVEAYKTEETNKFDAMAREHAAQLADKNARAFFSNKDWTKKDWDWVSGVSEISNPFFARIRMIESEKTQTTMYTPLQLWSSHNGYKILQPDMEAPTLVDDEDKREGTNGATQ